MSESLNSNSPDEQPPIDDLFREITGSITAGRTIEEQRATFDDVTARQEAERDESDMRAALLGQLPPAARKDSMLTELWRIVWPNQEEIKIVARYVVEDTSGNLVGRAESVFPAAIRRQADRLVHPADGFTMVDAGLIFEQVDELLALKSSTLPNLRDDLRGIYNQSLGQVIDPRAENRQA